MLTTHFSKLWRLIFFGQRKILFKTCLPIFCDDIEVFLQKNTTKDRLNPSHRTCNYKGEIGQNEIWLKLLT